MTHSKTPGSLTIVGILALAQAEAGGTFRLYDHGQWIYGDPIEFPDGYIVGTGRTQITDTLYPNDLVRFLRSVPAGTAVTEHGELVGFWRAPDGRWHIDEVCHVMDLTDALELAKNSGQLCIWDCAKEKEVWL